MTGGGAHRGRGRGEPTCADSLVAGRGGLLQPRGRPRRATEYAEYFIRDRRWSHDDFNALGMVLDAGGTVHHHVGASQAQQTKSAWITSAAVHYLAERGGGDQLVEPVRPPPADR